MEKWADYCVSKLNFDKSGNWIDKVMVHEDLGTSISKGVVRDRKWMIAQSLILKTFCSITKKDGSYQKYSDFKRQNGLFSWGIALPNILTKRNVFVSFHHGEPEVDADCGQRWKEKFEKLFAGRYDTISTKSVQDGDIGDGIKTETIRQKIRDNHIADATVTIVLIGPETWKRKHVDWEISSSIIDTKNNKRCGLLGIFLPTHNDFGKAKFNQYTIPPRLYYNFKSGFAKLYHWNEDPDVVHQWIEDAFQRRSKEEIDDSYPRFGKNRSDESIGWEPHKKEES
tara:strand:+ start:2786 stop:3634 length:849 start_codon:yes stop_codon:yes gene_type:complete